MTPTIPHGKPLPRWPLLLIALPAAVAVWTGWVGLGQLSGFGEVQPLPGILPLHVDTASAASGRQQTCSPGW